MRNGPRSAPVKRLVLVGGGHAHVGVLKSLGMKPEPGLEVVLVAKELDAPYSGMLPGLVAGHYPFDACHIDLVRLAHFAGARLIHGTADGVDRAARRVHIGGRPPIAFDLLSIDTGITPDSSEMSGAEVHAILVKPVSTFAPRWERLRQATLSPEGPRRIVVVGTGAAGFELVLAMRHRLRTDAPDHGLDPEAFKFTLVGSGGLLPTHNATARRLAAAALREQRIELIEGDAVVAVDAGAVRLASGRTVVADAAVVTTKARAPEWFAATGLSLDAKGFLGIEPTLQVVGEADIFAAGDCATVLAHPREKAGVFAVRQSPHLDANLRLRARGLDARPFTPQRVFLTLLSLGDRDAIAARGAFAARGRWAWTMKDRIDVGFMRKFQDLPPVELPAADAGEQLLCAGCAAKVGPGSLERALSRLEAELPSPPGSTASSSPVSASIYDEDVAIRETSPGQLELETIDGFPAIWPDPYVLGEIIATHALSDILAKGGAPDRALAMASLPPAARHLVEDDLFQLLAGIRSVLDAHGARLIGGHSSRTEELSAGLYVAGTVPRERIMLKAALRPGDRLVLTKPLGTGILFQGWMRREAWACEVTAALAAMRVSNVRAAESLFRHGAKAATDVTGFGLAGHLIQMLRQSGLAATLSWPAIARLDGVDRLLAAGIRSSLFAENIMLADEVAIPPGLDAGAVLGLLFDPQTSGGLLAGLGPQQADAAVAELAAAGGSAQVIGIVEASSAGVPRIRVVEHATLDVSGAAPLPAPIQARHGPKNLAKL